MLKIFQIADDYDPAKPSAEQSPKWHARREAIFGDDIAASWAAGYYSHVANVATDDKEEAFEIMNLWTPKCEAKVTRLAPLHSLSVGDVVVDEAGVAHYVDRFGYKLVEG